MFERRSKAVREFLKHGYIIFGIYSIQNGLYVYSMDMLNKVRPRMGSNVRHRLICYKQLRYEVCVVRFDCISTPEVWHYYRKRTTNDHPNPEAGDIINCKLSELGFTRLNDCVEKTLFVFVFQP